MTTTLQRLNRLISMVHGETEFKQELRQVREDLNSAADALDLARDAINQAQRAHNRDAAMLRFARDMLRKVADGDPRKNARDAAIRIHSYLQERGV